MGLCVGFGEWLVVFRQIAIRVRTPQFVVPLLAAEEIENEVTYHFSEFFA